jgi:hypothetical protein
MDFFDKMEIAQKVELKENIFFYLWPREYQNH